MGGRFDDVPAPQRGICSICQSPVRPREAFRACEECRALFHDECWQHNDGCGTYGCSRAPRPTALAQVEIRHRGGWGDIKMCPGCGIDLDSAALKCPSCKARFEARAPMTPEEYQTQLLRAASARRATWQAMALFGVSALGILAPATLIYGMVWKRRRRQEVGRGTGMSEVLVSMSGLLSFAYLVLMLAIFGFGF